MKTAVKDAAAAEEKKEWVSKHDLIAEVVEKYPEGAEVLLDFGVGCVGCYVSEFETLEQGILGHGFSEEELDQVVADLNEIATELEKDRAQ